MIEPPPPPTSHYRRSSSFINPSSAMILFIIGLFLITDGSQSFSIIITPNSKTPMTTTTTTTLFKIKNNPITTSKITTMTTSSSSRQQQWHRRSELYLQNDKTTDTTYPSSSSSDNRPLVPSPFTTSNHSSSSSSTPTSSSAHFSLSANAEITTNSSSRNATTSGSSSSSISALDKLIIVSSMSIIMALIYGLMTMSSGGSWRYYLAGGICASTSHAITTPIDVVKTRQQVDPTLTNLPLLPATRTIIASDGPRILLSGLGPTTFGYLIEGAVKFGIYEVLKPLVKSALLSSTSRSTLTSLSSSSSVLRLLTFGICGTVSGIAASVMLCPMEALRIRLVAEPEKLAVSSSSTSSSQDNKKSGGGGNWITAGLLMLRMEGIGGLCKGMTAMMSKQIPYTVTKQVSFDYFTGVGYDLFLRRGVWGLKTSVVKVMIPLISALFASLLSGISSQPGDMLLSVVNAHEGNRRTRDFAKDIWKKDGWRGFFVGMKARFWHVGIIVTVQLLIYDFVKRICGIPATGSC